MTATMDYQDTFVDHLIAKPEISTNVDTASGASAHKAEIGTEALGLVMTMLSDAYSDPIEAVIREVIANGIDAHAVVSNAAPVRVTAPLESSPIFVVADSGVGMTPSQLKKNFADYGNSLKAGERITIGRFGIGAKSPYAVTSQFTVVTTHRGRTVTALFSLGADGTPEHRVVTDEITAEADGTTVTIPVDPEKIEQWRARLRTVLSYMDPALVEVAAGRLTPDPDAHITARLDAELSTDEVGVLRGADYDINRYRNVVMGNIGYEMPAQMVRDFSRRLVFFAPPSSLELTHTRETIKDTQHNRDVLESMAQRWHGQVFAELLADLARAETELDKIVAARPHRPNRQNWETREMLGQLGRFNPMPQFERHYIGPLRHEATCVRYAPSEKRERLETVALEALVPLARRDEHHLLLDVGDNNAALSDEAVLRRVTTAVAAARQSDPDLTVMIMSPAHLQAALDAGAEGDDEDEARLPLLRTEGLPWIPLDRFLAENKPVRITSDSVKGSLRTYFEQFDPTGKKPLYVSVAKESETIAPGDLDGLLDLTESRTIVLCDKTTHELVKEALSTGRAARSDTSTAELFCSKLHDAVFVRNTSRSHARLAEAHSATVVMLDAHVRNCLTATVEQTSDADMGQLRRFSSSVIDRLNDYRRLSTDQRVPEEIRDFVASHIPKGQRWALDPAERRANLWVNQLIRRTERGRTIIAGDPVAEEYPLLSEFIIKIRDYRVSDELLETIISAELTSR